MKKLLAILLTVCFMLGVFAACTNDNTPANTNEPASNNNNENPGQTQTNTPVSEGLDLSVSKEPKKDWVTYLTLANEMETFNILYSQNNKELRVLTSCIDGLLSNDNRGNLVPAIAETWGTEDGGKTWTNVVSLDDIKGDKGDPGDPGEPAPEDPGDEGGRGLAGWS